MSFYPSFQQQQPAAPGRSAAVDELQRAFPSCRALNAERSALDLPIEIQPGRQTALRITLSPMYPQERPGLTVLVPVQNPAVDSGGRVRCRTLDEWDWRVPGKANLVAAVREALGTLLRPAASGSQGDGLPGPSSQGLLPRHSDGPGPGPGPSSAASSGHVDLDSLPTAELEQLLTDEEAFKRFQVAWLSKTQAAKTIQEIHRQNVALAQENLAMQDSIDEARNHVAVVRSSEFASIKSHFDELYQRQEVALSKLSPVVLYNKLKAEVDKLDDSSSGCEDAFLQGTQSIEQFVDQYLQQRIEYHKLDLVRQAAQYTGENMPNLNQRWAEAGHRF